MSTFQEQSFPEEQIQISDNHMKTFATSLGIREMQNLGHSEITLYPPTWQKLRFLLI